MSDRKIESINGLRGVAILLVIVHHLFIPYFVRQPTHADPVLFDPDGPLAMAIRNAAHGVDIFFVLSGFVLYLPYRVFARRFATRADVWTFYRHRANRLLPLYAIVVIVGLVFHAQSPIGDLRWFAELAGLSTALMDFSPHGFMPPSNIVLWSVGVEIWFSVLFPFLVLAIVRWGIWRVVVATTVVCMMFQAAGLLIAVDRVGQFLPFTTGVAGKCFEFLFGMLVCDRYVRAADAGVAPGRALLGGTAGLVVCVAAVLLLDAGPVLGPRLLGILLFAAGFSLFMLCVLLGPRVLRWPFERWWLQVLGCMCYSIYAWHGIMLNVMIPPASEIETTWRLMPLFLVLTLALSALSYRYIEFGIRRDWRPLFLLAGAANRESAT